MSKYVVVDQLSPKNKRSVYSVHRTREAAEKACKAANARYRRMMAKYGGASNLYIVEEM